MCTWVNSLYSYPIAHVRAKSVLSPPFPVHNGSQRCPLLIFFLTIKPFIYHITKSWKGNQLNEGTPRYRQVFIHTLRLSGTQQPRKAYEKLCAVPERGHSTKFHRERAQGKNNPKNA